MTTLTQSDLYDAIQNYMRNERRLLSEAEASVVEWKYANAEMFGLFPLFNQIGFHIDEDWRPAERAWLPNDPDGFAYRHGIDSNGKVRIVSQEKESYAKVFIYLNDRVDEFRFGNWPKLKRWIRQDGKTTELYDYDLQPHHQYSHEVFDYDGERCAKSTEHSWFVSDGKWQAARWLTICTFEYDGEGLVRVYRDMGKIFGGNKLVYVRPPLRPNPNARPKLHPADSSSPTRSSVRLTTPTQHNTCTPTRTGWR